MESNDKEVEVAPTVGSQALASQNESVSIEENEIPQNETLDAEITGPDGGNKRKFRSPAWYHFERRLIGGKRKAICNDCKKLLGGKSKNGTIHLLDHIKTCLHKKLKTIKQPLLQPTKFNDGTTMLGTYHFNQDHGRTELANLILLHEYPLSMVDRGGFRRFHGNHFTLHRCIMETTKLACKTNGIKYPILNDIAKDVLAIPVKTVVFESTFSASRRVLSAHRNRLHLKTVEALMCARDWLWSKIQDSIASKDAKFDNDSDIEESELRTTINTD